MAITAPPAARTVTLSIDGQELTPDFHAIQRRHGWLPREELVRLSRERRRPLYEIEGLISFYIRTSARRRRRGRRSRAATTSRAVT